MSSIVEFSVFGNQFDYTQRVAVAGKAEGFLAQYAGPKIEDPSQVVHVTIWTSAAAHKSFASARGGGGPLTIEVLAVGEESTSLTAALESPCTEVFTGYGAQSQFVGNVLTFRSRMDAVAARPIGYKAAAVVATTENVTLSSQPGVNSAWAGAAVKLVIGWTSREAHLEAKDKPEPIASNIGLLRDHISAGNMYHVNFTKL